ncbi:TIM protein, partial [Erithacus rubecula]|nr:TIM protein [Erithacus rubecula]
MEEHWVPEEGAGQDLAQHLHQEGLAGPLRWLENCLRRVAGDREEDGVSHPVPLVPLTEENEDAMEDRRFQTLLRQLGLRPPASEQESFWRIPAALTPQQLRRAAASIAHHGPPGAPQDLPEPPRCPQDVAAGERWGWGWGIPRCGAGSEPPSLCPSAEPQPAGLGSDSESEEPVPVPVPSPVQPRSKRRRELANEDEDGGSSGGFSPSALSWG